MDVLKKILNVFGILLAWVLSIALVVMLIATPLAFSTLDMLSADAITDVLKNSLVAEDDRAAAEQTDYYITSLSSKKSRTEVEIPDADNIKDMAKDMLENLIGEDLKQKDVEMILSSDAVEEFISIYTDGFSAAITGEGEEIELDEDLISDFVENNIDEIVDIAKRIAPEYADISTREAKEKIRELVEENADEILDILPQPQEIIEAVLEETPELEILFQVIAQRQSIKLAIIGAIVVLSLLIFLCRIPGLRGMRWLATNLFIGTGFNAIITAVVSMGSAALESIISVDEMLSSVLDPILSVFSRGMLIRTCVMLGSAVVLLVAYLVIKAIRKKKTAGVKPVSAPVNPRPVTQNAQPRPAAMQPVPTAPFAAGETAVLSEQPAAAPVEPEETAAVTESLCAETVTEQFSTEPVTEPLNTEPVAQEADA